MTSTLLSPMFSHALGSKQPFLSWDTPSKSHVVAVLYSLRRVFPCMQAFKLIIIDHVHEQCEPGCFSSRGLESRLNQRALKVTRITGAHHGISSLVHFSDNVQYTISFPELEAWLCYTLMFVSQLLQMTTHH